MSQVRGRPFQPGNTFGRGRPKGSRNKLTQKMQELLQQKSEHLMTKCVLMAMQGDRVAMRLCMERIFPAPREGFVHLPLPGTQTLADIKASSQRVVQAVAQGRITPTAAESISRVLDDSRRAIDSRDIESRIEQLEAQAASEDKKEGGYR